MLLIVEGSNKVGKSTLIKEIKAENPDAIVLDCRTHKIYNDPESTQICNNSVAIAVLHMAISIHEADPDALVILDRFHISEIVYGAYDRNYNAAPEMIEIDRLLCECDMPVRLIYMNSQYKHLEGIDPELLLRYKRLQVIMSIALQYSNIERKVLSLDGQNGIGSNTVDYCLQ